MFVEPKHKSTPQEDISYQQEQPTKNWLSRFVSWIRGDAINKNPKVPPPSPRSKRDVICGADAVGVEEIKSIGSDFWENVIPISSPGNKSGMPSPIPRRKIRLENVTVKKLSDQKLSAVIPSAAKNPILES